MEDPNKPAPLIERVEELERLARTPKRRVKDLEKEVEALKSKVRRASS